MSAELNDSESESSWSSTEEDNKKSEYNSDKIIQDVTITSGEIVKEVDSLEPQKYKRRRREKSRILREEDDREGMLQLRPLLTPS